MHSRCPNAHYVGLARLKGYKWIINSRGYANVVELPKDSPARLANEVWGLVFYLTPSDEAKLDRNEGVPYAYTKEILQVEFWEHRLGDGEVRIDVEAVEGASREVLVYVDRKRVSEAEPKDEYVVRMNRGIDDAVVFGMPVGYVQDVLRKFIPELEDVDGEIARKADEQALEFKDENELKN